mmetsp:Transcript_3374/g.9834  ORF Transcript_3374/g.9834 Transcript_3374/m.9834 type:complete len:82 (-) Transcript_3374:882-1127(-)
MKAPSDALRQTVPRCHCFKHLSMPHASLGVIKHRLPHGSIAAEDEDLLRPVNDLEGDTFRVLNERLVGHEEAPQASLHVRG